MSTNTTAKNKNRGPVLPAVSSTNQTIMATSSLFHREELLPRYGFTSKDPNTTKDPASLRIKFTETEDNLLALGMKQFQKNWKLIQTHLLPVKTPKQLHIRCKNLLSNRAQMNVVKYLRQNNSVWKLSTKVRPISSPGKILLLWRLRKYDAAFRKPGENICHQCAAVFKVDALTSSWWECQPWRQRHPYDMPTCTMCSSFQDVERLTVRMRPWQ